MLIKKWALVFIVGILFIAGLYIYFIKNKVLPQIENELTDNPNLNLENDGGLDDSPHPLSIESLRLGEYPGSDIVIEQTLEPGTRYKRYIASYKSEGLKIYALLTVPNATPPDRGFPAIIFNHGYIPPAQYKTTERYVAYVDTFARNGYVVFKPDYRGHGNSEGSPSGAYGSSSYTVDVLNALTSVKNYPGVDPNRIGMWGHSMGGYITLRNMVVNKDIKAGVIWAGVVGSYPDLLERWRRRLTSTPASTSTSGRGRWRQELVAKYGEPSQNPEFWNSISANSYLADISGPLQLHHGTSDSSVPTTFSKSLEIQMKDSGRDVELFIYEGDDHNLSKNFSLAIRRSIEFFDKYLKG